MASEIPQNLQNSRKLLSSNELRLGERRVYRPVIGWDYDKPPDDLKPVVSGLWWMGYRLEKETADARQVSKCE